MPFAPLIDDAVGFFSKSKREAMKGPQGLAYGLFKGNQYMQRPGANPLTGARLAGRYAGRGIKAGWQGAWGGYTWVNLPMAAFAAGSAPVGHKLSTFAGAAIPSLGYLVGSAFGGPVGGIAASLLLDSLVSKTGTRGMQFVHDVDRNTQRLGTGGAYVDTQRAFTMRQAAAQEMSHSLLNARTYLGREAAFVHA